MFVTVLTSMFRELLTFRLLPSECDLKELTCYNCYK